MLKNIFKYAYIVSDISSVYVLATSSSLIIAAQNIAEFPSDDTSSKIVTQANMYPFFFLISNLAAIYLIILICVIVRCCGNCSNEALVRVSLRQKIIRTSNTIVLWIIERQIFLPSHQLNENIYETAWELFQDTLNVALCIWTWTFMGIWFKIEELGLPKLHQFILPFIFKSIISFTQVLLGLIKMYELWNTRKTRVASGDLEDGRSIHCLLHIQDIRSTRASNTSLGQPMTYL